MRRIFQQPIGRSFREAIQDGVTSVALEEWWALNDAALSLADQLRAAKSRIFDLECQLDANWYSGELPMGNTDAAKTQPESGMKLCPREPTQEMEDAASPGMFRREVWLAMYDAAPAKEKA